MTVVVLDATRLERNLNLALQVLEVTDRVVVALNLMDEARRHGIGVDPDALYDVITHSAGNSWMFENRVPHILKGDYTPLSAVDIFVKDLGMVLDTARTSKFPLPLSAAAHQMFMMASTAGHGGEDDSAVIKIFPGIELPGKAE